MENGKENEEMSGLENLKHFLFNCYESDNFYSRICAEEEEERMVAANQIVQTIKGWISNRESEEYSHFMQVYLFGLVRLSIQNPFENVREIFRNLLEELKENAINVPEYYEASSDVPSKTSPSAFISPNKLPSFTKDEDTLSTFKEIFSQRLRIPHVSHIMGYYASYLSKFGKVYTTIMTGPGPVPQPWRHYLALLAASRHSCRYLILSQQCEFFQSGGDLTWLESVQKSPLKIQKLSLLNGLLAHKPWTIKPQHIQELTTGENNWSVPELVQAIVILSTFHSLAGFVAGMGIMLEIDRRSEHTGTNSISIPATPDEDHLLHRNTEESNAELLSKLKFLSEKSDTESVSSMNSNPEFAQKYFEESEIHWRPKKIPASSKKANITDFSHYSMIEMGYEEFDVNAVEYKIFPLRDCCWEDHGYSLINRYYPGAGDILDDLFSETLSLTDYSLFNSENIDTGPFRQAVWYYVLRLKGMFHDDYDYSQVNQLLNKTLKMYINKVACSPEHVSEVDYGFLGIALLDAEKTHINYLILESRRQAEILYALNAIRKHMGS